MTDLQALRDEIKAERPYVGRKEFSHNIIGSLLAQIAQEHGKAEANRAIRELGLKRLGWNEEPEEAPNA